jgi:hypothetical protein
LPFRKVPFRLDRVRSPGAAVSGNETAPNAVKEALVLFLGPVPGILLGIGAGFAYLHTGHPLLKTAMEVCLFLNLFNLLPFHPLLSNHPRLGTAFKALTVLARGLQQSRFAPLTRRERFRRMARVRGNEAPGPRRGPSRREGHMAIVKCPECGGNVSDIHNNVASREFRYEYSKVRTGENSWRIQEGKDLFPEPEVK